MIEVLPVQQQREEKFGRLRALIERQRQRIHHLQRENRQLLEENMFKANQINVLNIRLEAYSLMKKHEQEKDAMLIMDSQWTAGGESIKPFGFDQISTQIPEEQRPSSIGSLMLQQQIATVQSYSNISLSYTAEREVKTPFPSEELLPKLSFTEFESPPKVEHYNDDRVNSSTMISNRAYITYPLQGSFVKHKQLPQQQPLVSTRPVSDESRLCN